MPHYPGSTCAGFWEDTFGEELVTEVEYVVESSLAEVRERHLDAFARSGWTVTGSALVYGEWIYNVTSGARHGELVEPAANRRGPAGGLRTR